LNTVQNGSLEFLPLGAIEARGWLLNTLKLQAAGLTGQLEEVPLRQGFRVNEAGADSVWLGGTVGEDFILCRSERAPYYVRGLTALAYVLKDAALMETAARWMENWFMRQDSDGNLRARGVSDYEWWPRMLITDAVRFYFEATGDERALSFLSRYFSFQAKQLRRHPLTRNLRSPEGISWASFRGGDNLDQAAWLYRRTGEPYLLDLAREINRQTFPWEERFLSEKPILSHGVNLAHGLRKPAVQYQLWPEEQLARASFEGLSKVMEQHGQPAAVFSGDEKTHGRGPAQGTELCTVVELLRTYQTLAAVFGGSAYTESLERLAYNALPAALAPDFRSHQYFSQPNQVYCTLGRHGFHNNRLDPPYPIGPWYRDALTFGAPAGYPCCFYNFHLGWPLFTAGMFLRNGERGLAAAAYGPCAVNVEIDGVKVSMEEETAYPFDGFIELTIQTGSPLHFSLSLPVPRWCREAEARVGEVRYCAGLDDQIVIDRLWCGGDKVLLRLPMEPSATPWCGDALIVERGPLLFVYSPEELWVPAGGSTAFPTYEVLPQPEKPFRRGKRYFFVEPPCWNYGLSAEEGMAVETDLVTAKKPDLQEPWHRNFTPVKLRVKGYRLTAWERSTGRRGLNAGPLPRDPVPQTPKEEIILIPYGAARLRISIFPAVCRPAGATAGSGAGLL
jgi:hypothetical protein